MITGKIAAAVAGPVGIAHIVTKAAGEGFVQLFQLIALISVNLGFINLFPIPILDGGHVIFALIEKIKGGPLDPKKVNIANIIGLSIILAIFLFYTGKDIIRLVVK
jgi:regulator of sigma E protease